MRVSRGARRESCSLNPSETNDVKKNRPFSAVETARDASPRGVMWPGSESAKTRLKPKELDS